jgi:hypothetical protein
LNYHSYLETLYLVHRQQPMARIRVLRTNCLRKLWNMTQTIPPTSATTSSYALFMHKSNPSAVQVADELFQRAIRAHAVHPRNLANYATFLWKTHAEPLRIEQYFERAVDADPASASALVQYAAYQQEKGNIMQGKKRHVVGRCNE